MQVARTNKACTNDHQPVAENRRALLQLNRYAAPRQCTQAGGIDPAVYQEPVRQIFEPIRGSRTECGGAERRPNRPGGKAVPPGPRCVDEGRPCSTRDSIGVGINVDEAEKSRRPLRT